MLAGASALGPYWLYRGQFAEGRHWLALALAGSTAGAVTVRARAQGWSARLALEDGWGSINPGEAPTYHRLNCPHAMENAQDRRGEMRASEHLSYALRLYGDHERATGVTDESLAVCHEPELGWWKAELLHRKALLSQQAGDDRAAAELARNCIAAAETSGNEHIRVRALQALATSTHGGDAEVLTNSLLEVLELSESFGDRPGIATTLTLLGVAASLSEDGAAAGGWLTKAIVHARDIGYWHGAALATATVAAEVAALGQWHTAARLHGALVAHLPTLRARTPRYAFLYEQALDAARSNLGEAEFEAALAEGAKLRWDHTLDAAVTVAEALATTTDRSPLIRPCRPAGAAPASPACRPENSKCSTTSPPATPTRRSPPPCT